MFPIPRLYLLITSFVLFSASLFSQQRYERTLLWRITGKGSARPSYLFGTMHLTDQRIFNFGDSVYKAIQNTDGLAIEISPDEMGLYYANKLLDDADEGKAVKDILTKNEFKKYNSALSKRFGKPADEVTTSDVLRVKNQWVGDMLEKGEMSTFVDAYLYNLARKQGKWLGGIEDMSDQANLLEDLVDKSDIDYLLANDKSGAGKEMDSAIEVLKRTYIAEDLDKIELITTGGDAAARDAVLIKRNVKMARRMDSLIAFRTMFLAVGAAHLPGDSGVIELLRGRGFKVEPVLSSKKIPAKEYKVKEVQIPWITTKDPNDLYTISMPANPAEIKMKGTVDVKFLFDLFDMSVFWTMGFEIPPGGNAAIVTVDDLAKGIFKDNKIKAVRTLTNNGVQGKEYVQQKDNAYMRMQVFLNGKRVYMTMMTGYKKNQLASANANKFFESLKINTNPPVSKGQHLFIDSMAGVSFTTPFKMQVIKIPNEIPQGWKMTYFNGNSLESGVNFLFFSREIKPNYFIISDSVMYVQFIENSKKQSTILHEEKKIIEGHEVMEVTGQNILDKKLYTRVWYMNRDGRSLIFYAIGDSLKLFTAQGAEIFNSIHFVQSPKIAWNTQRSEKGYFSSWMPRAPQWSDEQNVGSYFTYDTTSSTTFFILPDTLNKYAGFANIDSFWNHEFADYQGFEIIKNVNVTNGELQGKELIVKYEGNENSYGRIRMLINGRIVYKLSTKGSKSLVLGENANKFFSDFRTSAKNEGVGFVLKSKSKSLIDDLQSSDSATRYDAYTGLRLIKFTGKDVELLHNAVFNQYKSPYDTLVDDIVNLAIAEKLIDLKSNTTIPYLKAQYSAARSEDFRKKIVLVTLAKIKTSESYNAIGELLKQSLPKIELGYRFGNELLDSSQLALSIYKELGLFATDTANARLLARISTQLMDDSLIDLAAVRPYEESLIRAADLLAPKLKEGSIYEFPYAYQLPSLLEQFNTPKSNEVLQKWLIIKEIYRRKDVAISLIKNDQQVSPAVLKSIAADAYSRADFYQELKGLKKSSLFPKEFLKQSFFAESSMSGAASDDDEPEKLEFIAKKVAKYKGKQYTFYLYRVDYDSTNEESNYLGVAGGFDVAGKLLEPRENITGLYWKESFDRSRLEEMFQAFLDMMSEEAEAPEEEM